MTRRRALLAAAGLGGLAACSPAPDAAVAQQPLRVAIDLWPGYFPAVLADELGWLAPAGVALKLAFPADTDRMIADFAAGQYDLIGASLGDLIALTRGHLGVEVIVVCDESSGGDAVLLRRGVTLETDRPLTIGTNLGGFGEVFLHEFIDQRRLQHKRWTWVNADAAEVPRLLASGMLDVGHTWEPYASQAVAAGASKLFSSAETPGLVADVLVATRVTVQRRRPPLQAFVQQWFRAVDWWSANPLAAVQLISRRLHLAQAKVSLQGVRLLDLAHNRRMLGAGGAVPALAPVVQRYSDFFVAKGTVGRPLDALALLQAELLP